MTTACAGLGIAAVLGVGLLSNNDDFISSAAQKLTIHKISPDVGPKSGHITITVTGTGFTDKQPIVKFGSTEIDKFKIHDHGTKMTFTLPKVQRAGKIDLTITTPNRRVIAYDAFTYCSKPKITEVAPDDSDLNSKTKVKIYGSNFIEDDTTVMFGSHHARITHINHEGTKITAIVPAGDVGTVDVKVITPGGEYTLEDAFTYNPDDPPAPVITSSLIESITAANTNINYQILASNNPTSFNATGLPQGLTIDSNTGIISGTLTIAGSYNITISATNDSGTGSALLVLTIMPGIPASITPLEGTTPQSKAKSTPFNSNLKAIVKDNYGNKINGISVTFTAPLSSNPSCTFGAIDGPNTITVLTNSDGIADSGVVYANSNISPEKTPYLVKAIVVSDSSVSTTFELINTATF